MSICVHGLGNIGLATAALFANNGQQVTGFDVDEEVVSRLKRGQPKASEPELAAYVEHALSNGFTVKNEPVAADAHLVCVQTPYDSNQRQAVLSYVKKAAETIAEQLRMGDTVILESTVPPGTTEGVFSRILSKSGLVPGKDFQLGYIPETVMPGNIVTELRTNPRIAGGISQASTDALVALYEPVTSGPIYEAHNPTVAEFAKLAQNAARDVNIAYANTLAVIAADYDIDVRTGIDLANNHPRVDILDPGPGVGGHCLPVDPLFLASGSDGSELIECAREVNDRMPSYVADQVRERLDSVQDATVALLGVTYKSNVSDTRNSPGLAISHDLADDRRPRISVPDGNPPSIEVRLHDPHADDPTIDLVSLDEAIANADAIVIAAGHDEFERLAPATVGEAVNNRLVVDPLGILERDRWVRHGFELVTI